MEKRTILAIALSFIILIAFDFVYRNYFAPEEPPQVVENTTPGPQETELQEAPAEEAESVFAQRPESFTPVSDTDTEAVARQEIKIRGDLYQAVNDNKGAVFASWILNDYRSSDGEFFNMIPGEKEELEQEKGEKWFRPGSLLLENEEIENVVNDEIYEVTVNNIPYRGRPLDAPVDVVLTLRRGDVSIKKEFSFHKDNYTVDLRVEAVKGGKDLEGKLLLAQDIGPRAEHIDKGKNELKAVFHNSEKIRRESIPDKEKGNVPVSGNILWLGLDIHYFSILAIPDKSIPGFEIRGFEITKGVDENDEVARSLLSVKIPVEGSLDCLVYFGPKKQTNLKAIPKYDLSGVIDYGWFSIIAVPLLHALRWINQYVNNYGWAIVLLTLLISIVLFPLRLKQMLSMRKMQKVQPKVKAIQERYKKYKRTDPKKAEMNQEIMALYKSHNVNPLGGCLPLLVQMPLLFAFFRLIQNSIELRHAPFMGWIQDLSTKDPYYVLPIVMGLTMYLSQKMTPMAPTTDPSQAKMMQFLPLIFMFFFLNMSSGLNLYFLCSNIFQVGFQKIAERWMGDGRNDRKPKQEPKPKPKPRQEPKPKPRQKRK